MAVRPQGQFGDAATVVVGTGPEDLDSVVGLLADEGVPGVGQPLDVREQFRGRVHPVVRELLVGEDGIAWSAPFPVTDEPLAVPGQVVRRHHPQ